MTKKVRRTNVKNGIIAPLGNGFSLAIGKYPEKEDNIHIGPNNKNGVSVNDGEILQNTGDTLRVFSAQPMFNGVSPTQLLYGGMNPNAVFNLQEQYKKQHRLNDDGTHYVYGGNKDNPPVKKYDILNSTYKVAYNRGDFTTKLSDEDEAAFQKWYAAKPVKMYEQASNADDFEHGYDWRGYWLNEWKPDGGKKEWAKMASTTKEDWHWPDTYKQPHHHTFSNESKYSNNIYSGGRWINNSFVPSKFNYDLEYALADNDGRGIIDRRNNKEFNYDDFVRFAKSHKEFNLTDNELKDVWDGIISQQINPATMAHLIHSESRFNKNAKASSTSASGLGQMTIVALKQMYGEEKGNKIAKEYADGKRSVKNQIADILEYTKNYNSKDTTYGFLKVKHLVPNASLTGLIPKVVWNGNMTKSQKNKLNKEKSTLNDFINVLNDEYNNYMFDYNRSFKNGGIYIKPSKRGTFTAAAKKHGMSVQSFASKVLANKDNYTSAMVKKANFAKNASKWKHLYGGEESLINPLGERPNANNKQDMKNHRKKALSGTQLGLLSAGMNTLGAGIGSLIQQNAINRLRYTPRVSKIYDPVKLKTNINIAPQLAEINSTISRIFDAADKTSASSRNRFQKNMIANTYGNTAKAKLFGEKENKETELINADRMNQQGMRNKTIDSVIDTLNTNIAGKDQLNNLKRTATSNNWTTALNTITGAWGGPNGFFDREAARNVKAGELLTQSIANPTAAKLLFGDIDLTTEENRNAAFKTIYDWLNNNRLG